MGGEFISQASQELNTLRYCVDGGSGVSERAFCAETVRYMSFLCAPSSFLPNSLMG